MYYKKILEIREDDERIYFIFSTDTGHKIIGVPKMGATNKNIYAGTTLTKLDLVNLPNIGMLLSNLMRIALRDHPKLKECEKDCVQLLLT